MADIHVRIPYDIKISVINMAFQVLIIFYNI